jgi:hypothetical protein
MSIFKSTFRESVANQIRVRQKAIADRTPTNIQYFNSRNAWVRMTSAVNVGGKNTLAQQYVLQGGTLTNIGFGYIPKAGIGDKAFNAYSNTTPSGTTNQLGIRPMPGITGVEIMSKSAYGSLRTATVSFVAWDIKQLEDLELLYMRPGYTVLLEWGWAPYLDEKGGFSSAVSHTDIVNATPSQEQIYKDLFGKSANGNYDATYGKIQNYSWKARPDGGYDCTTTIITIGEIIDSLKVNYSPFHIGGIEKNGIIASRIPELPSVQDQISGSYSQNIVAGICHELYAIVDKKVTTIDTPLVIDDNKEYYDFYKSSIKEVNNNANITPLGGTYSIYITLESFVKVLNKYVLPYTTSADGKTSYSYIKVSTNSSTLTSPSGSAGQPLLCLGNFLQLSTDPSVCLIANQAWEDPSGSLGINYKGNNRFKPFISSAKKQNKGYFYKDDFKDLQYGVIGNIFVNLSYIYSLVTDKNIEAQDKTEKNDINLSIFLKNILTGINNSIGNVANLDLHCDPMEGNIIRIVDINYIDEVGRKEAYDNAFIFEMQKVDSPNGSIVRNYSFESQIFPEQSTIVAIGAQVKAGSLGVDSGTLVDFNQNLTDRIMPRKDVPGVDTGNSAEKLKKEAETFKGNLATLLTFLNPADDTSVDKGKNGADNSMAVNESSKYSNALRDMIKFFKNNFADNNKNRGIIPTKLSLTIDGIGGMIIGNMFRIPDRLLPKGYKGEGKTGAKIGFLVTGLKHSIQNNDWNTTIECQYIVLDEPLGTKLTDDYFKKILVYVQNDANFITTNPVFIPPGQRGNAEAMRLAGNAIFDQNGNVESLCARYTYSIASTYSQVLAGKAAYGTLTPAGGNAGDLSYRLQLTSLGYQQYNIGTISLSNLSSLITKGPWEIGDIITYKATTPVEGGAYLYGHTQIYTGGVITSGRGSSSGIPWASSLANNYGTSVVYSHPVNYEVFIFKKAITGIQAPGATFSGGGLPFPNVFALTNNIKSRP